MEHAKSPTDYRQTFFSPVDSKNYLKPYDDNMQIRLLDNTVRFTVYVKSYDNEITCRESVITS